MTFTLYRSESAERRTFQYDVDLGATIPDVVPVLSSTYPLIKGTVGIQESSGIYSKHKPTNTSTGYIRRLRGPHS